MTPREQLIYLLTTCDRRLNDREFLNMTAVIMQVSIEEIDEVIKDIKETNIKLLNYMDMIYRRMR